MKLSERFFYHLNKTKGKRVLTQIMPFIEPHRYESHHIIKLLAYVVIIVMDYSNIKHVKGDEQVIHDEFKNN